MSHFSSSTVGLDGHASGARTSALGVVIDLLERFERERVEYCHWKSNQHVAAGLAGDTDLDLLVGRGSSGAMTHALLDTGCRRFVAHPDRGYPGVEDYLGFDAHTGRLVHLHVHHQLTLGAPHLKGHRVPWERVALSTRRLDESGTIYVTDPHLELLLLVVRASLKLRTRDALRRRAAGAGAGAGMAAEYAWLVERVEERRLHDVARPLVGAEAARRLVAMRAGGTPDAGALVAFRRSAVPPLDEYRMFGAVEARGRRWARESRVRWAGVKGRVIGPSVPSRRVLPTGGRMIALIGADGSGKSSVARDLRRWLAWKVDVVPVYFGSGAGPKSLSRHVLALTQKAGTLLRRTTARPGDAATHGGERIVRHAPDDGVRSALRTLLRAWWALSLAHEKHVRITRARRARDRGAIVICDRFPQSQVAGVNDGPLLVDWVAHGSWLKRRAAERELAVYDELRRCPPDLVVKLHASPDVARRRKPDTGMELLRRKSQVVRDLKYPPAVQVVEVDADGAYEDVLREVKRMIWEVL